MDPRIFVRDLALLMAALALFALALVMTLQSDLGANSWMVFHHGISLQTPLTIGVAGIVVGIVILGASWLMGIRPGLGTVMNMFFVGIWTDVYLQFDLVPVAQGLPLQIGMLVGGAILLGFATALYIKTGFGAGPRDAFMLAITRKTDIRVGFIRWGMEVTVVILGILLGGSFGLGTILFAFMIGPSVDFFFNLLRVPTRRPRRAALQQPAGD